MTRFNLDEINRQMEAEFGPLQDSPPLEGVILVYSGKPWSEYWDETSESSSQDDMPTDELPAPKV